MKIRALVAGLAPAVAMVAAPPAHAIDVNFTGALVNSCILALSTPGLLAASATGTNLGSENAGGVAAVLAVTAIGSAPTLNFTAPALTSPAGWAGTAVTQIRWNSLSGKTQAYTSATSTATGATLIDTFTINAKVDSATGFAAGNYQVRTTVTCQQA